MPKGNTIQLPENLTIAVVEGLHQQLEEMLQKDKPVSIKAAGVTRADTAAIQLLGAFAVELAKRDLQCSWVDVSAELRNAAELLGMEKVLGFAPVV